MLDQLDAVRDHARHEDLVVRQLHVCQTCHSCSCRGLAASIKYACADPQHQVDEMPELEIVHARRDVDAVAGVEPHAVLGNAAQRVIDGLDALGDERAAFLDRGSGARS